jgi:hypothetical protein
MGGSTARWHEGMGEKNEFEGWKKRGELGSMVFPAANEVH